ncbi:MAG: hypothetical protein UR66_C0001G0123 [Candidatus Moranbacteria bacterium GW2011_GWE1_35_17]|nr:MAG: hypothetical protein UR66_C0001G0123 [Candidatus Moranbacteria bacterium GW2011_GWE1_35_17]KKP72064.1 MAG: hypothetical protein UR65_C0021G0003 [Candidatus Moranbacteria bacterium GW2011_GWE2_35_164]KKP82772.1 MAG: hypothetical protein UR82_C0032G0003 [Candidatus Moranbacteria bacterium GW2011_GWF1_35_5]KKP83670.1 MAG: hypothetical protein UR83_C0034G0006 [Candidatus Moranbacteria bacterium GW2011_GWF2_35_54]
MKRFILVTLFLSFFGFVFLPSANVLATYQPPAPNPNLNSATEYICYSQASGVTAAWSIIYKKSDFNCGGIPAGINFYPDYGIKVGCTGNGSNIAGGGSYDIYSYYSNSWHKDDWSGYGAVDNYNSLDSQIACSVDLPASYPGFAFQGSYYSYGQTIMPANYTPPNPQQLTVTRSPEAGGGVSDYPAGENIYCGIDSYEICEASFPSNTQVTLDASANAGYAFSHWEINDLAMADVDGSIDVTMDEVKNVVAVFVPEFGFPLSGYTFTTVPITAVMDHSLMGGFYSVDGKDDKVEAFNGEIGDAQYGIQITDGVRGYKQQSGNDFLAGYTYPDPDNEYLFYDEHPGFDFAVVNGTNVLAPFAGRLYWATTDPVNGNPGTYGTFYIDHGNGYTTWYLHCSGLTQTVVDEIALNGYAEVTKGQHIAESSNKGTTAYHLHFEVRKDGVDDEHVIDPYGWELWEE